jgi:hypothetical protein
MLTPQSINEPRKLPEPGAADVAITSLDPAGAAIGDPDVDMEVVGTGFTEQSVITFNGGDEPTVFISKTVVSTIVKPSTATTPGSYPVTVKSGAAESNALSFTFTEDGADPDALEDELEQAKEEGDFKSTHPRRGKVRRGK